MANAYRTWSKSRIPAAGDTAWNDEVDDNFDIIETLVNNIAIRQNRVISGVEVTDGGGLNANYSSGVVEVNGTRYSITGSSVALTAGSPGGRLKNYIYVNSSGTVVDSTTLPTGQFVMLSIADTDDADILRLSDLRIFAPSSIRFSAGTDISEFSTDGTMAGNSDDAVPTEKAVKEFVETERRAPSNFFINGEMLVAERATSVTGKTSSGYYTVDRMSMILINAGTFGYAQESSIKPAGFGNSYKIDCETAQASLAADAAHIFQQKFMGRDLQHLRKGLSSAKPVTVGFWIYSNKTGTCVVELVDVDNSRHIATTITINSASTWEWKEVTFAGDTSGALDNNDAYSLSVNVWLAAGSNYTSGTLATSWAGLVTANRAVGQTNYSDSASNVVYISGVICVEGSYTGPYPHKKYGDHKYDCEEYYNTDTLTQIAAVAYAAGAVTSSRENFPRSMRAAPTSLTISNITFDPDMGTYSSVASWRATKNGINPTFSVTGATANAGGHVSFTYTADAEI
jgi:hypothetical protein